MTAKPWDYFIHQHIDAAVAHERYDMCEQCPEFINLTKQCKKCGCFMPAKTKVPHAFCPLNKWGPVENLAE